MFLDFLLTIVSIKMHIGTGVQTRKSFLCKLLSWSILMTKKQIVWLCDASHIGLGALISQDG